MNRVVGSPAGIAVSFISAPWDRGRRGPTPPDSLAVSYRSPGRSSPRLDVDEREQHPAGDEEADDRENAGAARSGGGVGETEKRRPEIAPNFSNTEKNPKNSDDLSRGIMLANSDRPSA